MRLGIDGQLAKTLCSTNPCETMIEIVRHTQRNVKRWQDGDMRKRWTAAGMLVAEQQFRRIIGYRDLATLVIAIERHALAPTTEPVTRRLADPLPSDRQPRTAVEVPRRSGHPLLHNDDRIYALTSIIGIALLIFGLIEETETRKALGETELLPGLLPGTRSAKPTGRNVISVFQGLGLTYTHAGIQLDRLTHTQRRVLELLQITPPWPEQTPAALLQPSAENGPSLHLSRTIVTRTVLVNGSTFSSHACSKQAAPSLSAPGLSLEAEHSRTPNSLAGGRVACRPE